MTHIRRHFALLALVGACSLATDCASSPGPQLRGTGTCSAGGLEWAVGQPADEATMRRLSRESGAGLFNPIGPATITTKDLRKDRLRVFIDRNDTITAVRCE